MLYIVDIESVETRYTKQWKTHLPKLFDENGVDVRVISGPTDIPAATTPGAFLNFGGTNIYKARQVEEISRLFCEGNIKDGDYFLFTDAWHPGVINLKYMSELLGIKVKIGGLWHAGSYDPQDFLGRLIGDAKWVRHAERSMYECYDHNFFATDFHIKLFASTFLEDYQLDGALLHKKIQRVGWPMEYIETDLEQYKGVPKEDIILFPHRIAPEKQPELFDMLAEAMPNYEFIKCQELNLTKDEYHRLLAKSKIIFSANLQETLGISVYEGAILGSIPLMPDRLSYSEMWGETFKYNSEWTTNLDNAKEHLDQLKFKIMNIMGNHTAYESQIANELPHLAKFYHGTELVNRIKDSLDSPT